MPIAGLDTRKGYKAGRHLVRNSKKRYLTGILMIDRVLQVWIRNENRIFSGNDSSQSLRSETNLDYIECFTTKIDAAMRFTMDAHRQGWQEELKDGECSGYWRGWLFMNVYLHINEIKYSGLEFPAPTDKVDWFLLTLLSPIPFT